MPIQWKDHGRSMQLCRTTAALGRAQHHSETTNYMQTNKQITINNTLYTLSHQQNA